jgi:hypothetical protein
MNHPMVREARLMPALENAYGSLKAVLPENLDQVLSDIRGTQPATSGGEAAPQDRPAQPDAPAQPAPAQSTPADPAPAQPAPAPAQ